METLRHHSALGLTPVVGEVVKVGPQCSNDLAKLREVLLVVLDEVLQSCPQKLEFLDIDLLGALSVLPQGTRNLIQLNKALVDAREIVCSPAPMRALASSLLAENPLRASGTARAPTADGKYPQPKVDIETAPQLPFAVTPKISLLLAMVVILGTMGFLPIPSSSPGFGSSSQLPRDL